MGLKFKPGEPVRQIPVKPMEGVVTEATISGSDILFKVESGEGDDHRARWFKEDEIEAAPKTKAGKAEA